MLEEKNKPLSNKATDNSTNEKVNKKQNEQDDNLIDDPVVKPDADNGFFSDDESDSKSELKKD